MHVAAYLTLWKHFRVLVEVVYNQNIKRREIGEIVYTL